MKQLTALILLAFFTLQVFPVLEIGKLLSKKQLVEEVGELEQNMDDINNELKIDDQKQANTIPFGDAWSRHFSQVVSIAIQEAETLPKSFIPDILTPPPNGI